jgi:hypothetical protein
MVPTETALLPAPFWCTYAWNRPTSTGAGGSDPLWLCWRGKPWLAIHWRGYAASKWSQLERQLILGQRLSPIATSQHRAFADRHQARADGGLDAFWLRTALGTAPTRKLAPAVLPRGGAEQLRADARHSIR